MNLKYLCIFLMIYLLPLPIHAGTADSLAAQGPVHHFGADVRASYLLPTHDFFRGVNKYGKRLDKSAAAHLQYSFSFAPGSHYGKLYPTAYQGIGAALNTFFDKEEIGTPVSLYVFQGAEITRLSRQLSLDYEWNFGVSLGWRTSNYRSGNSINSFNTVVGSTVNAYINVGFLLSWHPSPDWKFSAGIDLSHYSNGNTRYPNAGVNTIGGRLQATRNFGNLSRGSGHRNPAYEKEYISAGKRFADRMTYDIIVYGAGRSKGLIWHDEVYISDGTFGILGLNFNPMYRVNKFLRAGISADVQYDESANTPYHVAGVGSGGKIKFHRPPLSEQLGGGLSLRAELVMPIFSVNVGFGHNVVYKGEELGGFYQILALKTDITKHLILHVGYKLRKFHDPNNLMLGVGWRFGNI